MKLVILLPFIYFAVAFVAVVVVALLSMNMYVSKLENEMFSRSINIFNHSLVHGRKLTEDYVKRNSNKIILYANI